MSLNGVPVIPVDVEAARNMKLSAPLIPKELSTLDYFTNPDAFEKVELAYSMLLSDRTRVHPVPSTVHSLEFSTMAVNNQPVKIEGIALDVLENTADGSLLLGPSRMVPVSEQCGTNIKCLLSKMKAKLRGMSNRVGGGCGGRPGSMGYHGMPHSGPHGASRERPHFRPYHAREPSFFTRAFHQVLLPIFIGLLAGMAFGAFAIVVSHIFFSLFRRITGRNPSFSRKKKCRGCRFSRRMRRKQRQLEQGNDEEKGALISEEQQEEHLGGEAPPAYDGEIAEGLEVVEKE